MVLEVLTLQQKFLLKNEQIEILKKRNEGFFTIQYYIYNKNITRLFSIVNYISESKFKVIELSSEENKQNSKKENSKFSTSIIDFDILDCNITILDTIDPNIFENDVNYQKGIETNKKLFQLKNYYYKNFDSINLGIKQWKNQKQQNQQKIPVMCNLILFFDDDNKNEINWKLRTDEELEEDDYFTTNQIIERIYLNNF